MRIEVAAGQRVGWQDGHDEAEGLVTEAKRVGARQLLTVAGDDGGRHTLIVDPNGPEEVRVIAVLSGDRTAEGLAHLIVAGCDPKIPIGCQLNILAAAVLSNPAEAAVLATAVLAEPLEAELEPAGAGE